MSLKFEVEDITVVDESVRGFYEEYEGKYRLRVEGIDDAKELKTALQKEREERKTAKEKLRALEAEREAIEKERLEASKKQMEQQNEFKTLYESEKAQVEAERARIAELEGQFNEFQNRINSKTVQAEVNAVAGTESSGGSNTELLAEQLLKYATVEDGEVVYKMSGIIADKAEVLKHLKQKYPSLFKGSGASGSGATGSGIGGTATSKTKGDFGGSRNERTAAIAARFNLN